MRETLKNKKNGKVSRIILSTCKLLHIKKREFENLNIYFHGDE